MNVKSKLFGTLAASAIALSMSVGMVSAAENYTAESDVTLKQGICSLSDIQAETASFGEWVWNGEDQYVAADPGNSNVAWLTANVKNHKPQGTCTIGVSSTGLGNGAIAPGNIVVNTTNPSYNNIPLSPSVQTGSGFQAGPLSASFTLNDVPDDLQPATYTGTINFVVNNEA